MWKWTGSSLEVSKKIMLISTVYEIYHAHKCYNANDYWHFNIYLQDKYNFWALSKKNVIFLYFTFCEQL